MSSLLTTPYEPMPIHELPMLRRRSFDWLLIALTLVLVGWSIVMVYSTTAIVAEERYSDSLYFVKRQAAAAVLGLAAMFLCARFPVRFFRKISPWCYVAAVGFLLLTLIPGLGDRAGGAQRWIQLPGFRFQPAEFVKLFFILFIAGYWGRHEGKISSLLHGIVKPFLLFSVVGVLLLVQPDFGSTSVIAAVTFAMAIAAGIRLRYAVFAGGGLLVVAAILIAVSPYRMLRVVSFLAPLENASGKGYQLVQSLIAVGTGQFFGVGLGASQQKLFFLPAAHTDFIFAVVAEELGLVGCLALIGLFLMFLWRGLLIAKRCADETFAFTAAVGLTMLIVAPALLNMGVVLGLLPTKGMVLPLFGYGGSSLLTSLIAVGILLAIDEQRGERGRLSGGA